jgi:putative transcriptional regulator
MLALLAGTDTVVTTRRVRDEEPRARTPHREGLSQGELAAAVAVSRQTINSIEQERYTPSLPLALALARFFAMTVEEMFDADR